MAAQVLDWSCMAYGNFGLIVVERLDDGTYRLATVLLLDDVATLADTLKPKV